MSVALVRLVTRAALGPTRKHLLKIIVEHVNASKADTAEALVVYAGLACLTWESELSLSTVKRTLKELEKLRVITSVTVPRPGRSDVAGYEVHPDRFPLRPTWNEAKAEYLETFELKKKGRREKGFVVNPFQDDVSTGFPQRKGFMVTPEGVHGDLERGSFDAQKGFMVNPELDLGIRSSELGSEQEHRARAAAGPDKEENRRFFCVVCTILLSAPDARDHVEKTQHYVRRREPGDLKAEVERIRAAVRVTREKLQAEANAKAGPKSAGSGRR